MTIDMTTDHIDMSTLDPNDLIVGPEGQTLAEAAAAEQAAARTRVTDLSRYREILDEVTAAALALRAAGVDRIMVDLSIDHAQRWIVRDRRCEPALVIDTYEASSADEAIDRCVSEYELATPDRPEAGDLDAAEADARTLVEIVVRAAEPDDDATVPAWATGDAAIASYIREAVLRQLPAAARAIGRPGLDETIYVRATGGYWQVQHAAISEQPYRPLALEGVSVADAALYGWVVCGAPRDAYVLVVPETGESLGVFVDDYVLSTPSPHYEQVHAFRPLTRADSDREVADSDPIVRAIHIKQQAVYRHASRCRAAQAALVQYVLDEDWQEHGDVAAYVREGGDLPRPLVDWHIGIPGTAPGVAQVGGRSWTADEGRRIVAALVAFELHGVGGPGGFSGDATASAMSWRAGLGKGRRSARDGAAWDSAIEAWGSRDVSPEDALLAVPHVRPVDLLWPMAYALHRAYERRADREESAAWCAVARAVMRRAEEPGSPSEGGALWLGQRYGVSP